jgi:hypothetical protein
LYAAIKRFVEECLNEIRVDVASGDAGVICVDFRFTRWIRNNLVRVCIIVAVMGPFLRESEYGGDGRTSAAGTPSSLLVVFTLGRDVA